MKNIESLYIHFPFCAHLCNYCDFFKRVSENKAVDYLNFQQYLEESYLEHEKLMGEHDYNWAPLKTLYFGGGTPSLWGAEGAIFFKDFLTKRKITLDRNCEFTLEVNPKAWTEDSIKAFRSIGVNRFSLGVQSLNANLIKYLDRFHTIDDVDETLNYFKNEKLNFSVDIMLGLPFSIEEKRDVILELETALKYNPSHFSVYILTVKENYKYFSQLPDEDYIAEEYLKVATYLKEKGFQHYEVSNFAKIGFESRHNLNYWKSKTVAAFGPSATGFLSEDKLRYKWKVNFSEYEAEYLTDAELKLEKTYMALRSREGMRKENMTVEMSKLFEDWRLDGYIVDEKEKYVLTSSGFLILDSLMDKLFINQII
jgi:oxygen-independent coproporphyrinogen-3 oxidase